MPRVPDDGLDFSAGVYPKACAWDLSCWRASAPPSSPAPYHLPNQLRLRQPQVVPLTETQEHEAVALLARLLRDPARPDRRGVRHRAGRGHRADTRLTSR